jgi:hypothetical protein
MPQQMTRTILLALLAAAALLAPLAGQDRPAAPAATATKARSWPSAREKP